MLELIILDIDMILLLSTYLSIECAILAKQESQYSYYCAYNKVKTILQTIKSSFETTDRNYIIMKRLLNRKIV